MTAHGRRDRSDATLIAGLLAGRTIAEAAAAAGMGERTARRRTQDPVFQARFRTAEGDLMSATATALGAACTRAVTTLVDLLDPATPASTRRSAAQTIIELRLRLFTDLDVDRRLAAIEAALAAGVTR